MITFKGVRIDNGRTMESNSIMQYELHPIKQRRVAQLWQEGKSWIEVIPDSVEVILPAQQVTSKLPAS